LSDTFYSTETEVRTGREDGIGRRHSEAEWERRERWMSQCKKPVVSYRSATYNAVTRRRAASRRAWPNNDWHCGGDRRTDRRTDTGTHTLQIRNVLVVSTGHTTGSTTTASAIHHTPRRQVR